MDNDLREVSRQLKSDKVTERRKGRKDCEDLLIRDKTNVAIPPLEKNKDNGSLGGLLIRDVLTYEIKEIESAKKRDKVVSLDVAQFTRRVCRHFVRHSQQHLQCVVKFGQDRVPLIAVVISHVLAIITEKRLEVKYRDEHRQILCDLLDIKVAHSLTQTPEFLLQVFEYLSVDMVDKSAIIHVVNQKIMKQLCRLLFADNDQVKFIIENIVTWFCDCNNLFNVVSDDPKSEVDLCATIADCCAILMEHHSINITKLVFTKMNSPLMIMTRHLQTQQLRDHNRDSFMRFLLFYMNLSKDSSYGCEVFPNIHPFSKDSTTQNHNIKGNFKDNDDHGITNNDEDYTCSHNNTDIGNSHMLDSLCVALSNEDSLKSIVVHSSSIMSLRQNRDTYHSPIQDPKVRLFFDVTATTYCLQRLRVVSKYPVVALTQGHENSESLFLNAFTSHTMLDQMFYRIFNYSSTPEVRSKSRSSNLKIPLATDGTNTIKNVGGKDTNFYGQRGVYSTSFSPTNPLLFEALLLILQSLIRLYPRGEFLLNGTDFERHTLPRLTRVEKLRFLLLVLKNKLKDAFVGADMKILGALLCTLNSLTRISAVLSSSNVNMAKNTWANLDQSATAAATKKLQIEWGELAVLLLQDPHLSRYGSICRRDSVSDHYTALLDSMITFNVVEPTNLLELQQQFWRLTLVTDHRASQSPSAFLFIRSLFTEPSFEILPVMCVSFINAVHEARAVNLNQDHIEGLYTPLVDNNVENAQFANMQEQFDKKTMFSTMGKKYLFEEIVLEEIVGTLQIMLYLVCWLEYQAEEASLQTRVPLHSCGQYCSAIDSLLTVVLPCSFGISDIITEESKAKNTQFRLSSPFIENKEQNLCNEYDEQNLARSPFGGAFSFDDIFENVKHEHDREREGDLSKFSNDSEIFHFLRTNLALDENLSLKLDTSLNSTEDIHGGGTSFDPAAKYDDKHDQFLRNMDISVTLLDLLCNKFTKEDYIRSQCTETSESLTSWQLACLLLCSCYASLSCDAERKKHSKSEEVQKALIKELLKASKSFWCLMDAQVAVLRMRIAHLKWNHISEYLTQLSRVVKNVADLHAFSTKNRTGSYTDAGKYRENLCNDLIELLNVIRDSAMYGGHLASEGNSGYDFDEPESPEHLAKKQRVVYHDEDFDIRDQLDIGKPKTAHARVLASQSGGDRNSNMLDLKDGTSKTARLVFTQEKRRAFSSCMNLFTVSSFEHDDAQEILYILKATKREASSSGDTSDTQSFGKFKRFGLQLDTAPTKSSLLKHQIGDCSLWVNSELQLCLAESLANIYSLNSVYYFIMSLKWEEEWGPLGMYKILNIVHKLTMRPRFFLCSQNDDSRRQILNALVMLVFVQLDNIQKNPPMYWKIRYMQLKCMSNFARIDSIYRGEPTYFSLNKEQRGSLRSIYILLLTEDPDMRVRQFAASIIPQIFRYFNFSQKIYPSIVKNENLVDISPEELAMPLFGVSDAIAIARMGVSNTFYIDRALNDLFILCCSRMAKRVHVSLSTGNYIDMDSNNENSSSMDYDRFALSDYNSSSQYPDFKGLLTRLATFMSEELSYATVDLLLLDYLRYLLYQWIVIRGWCLRTFPYELLKEISYNPPQPDTNYYKSFLLNHIGLIMPILCHIPDLSRRREEIRKISLDTGRGIDDNSIGATIISSYASIQAHVYLYRGSDKSTETGFEMNEYLDTLVSRKVLDDLSFTCRSDIVQELFCLYTHHPTNPTNSVVELNINPTLNDTYMKVTNTFDMLRKSLELFSSEYPISAHSKISNNPVLEILSECNLVEILSSIQTRIIQSQNFIAQLNVLSVLRIILRNIPFGTQSGEWINHRAINAVLNTIDTHSLHPTVLIESSKLHCEMATLFFDHVEDLMSNSSFDSNCALYQTLLIELFCNKVCFLFALQICRRKLRFSDDAKKTQNDTGRIDSADDNYDTEIFVQDRFVFSLYAPLIASITQRMQSKRSEIDAMWWNAITESINCISVSIGGIVDYCATSIYMSLGSLIPLPMSFTAVIGDDNAHALGITTQIRNVLESNPLSTKDEFSTIKDKIAGFVDVTSCLLRGESRPLTVTWLQLLNLSEQLGMHLFDNPNEDTITDFFRHGSDYGSVIRNAHVQLRNEEEKGGIDKNNKQNRKNTNCEADLKQSPKDRFEGLGSFWQRDSDLLAAFVSCMVNLCTLRSAPNTAFQNKVISFLGCLGSPDLLSLSHSSLPARVGDPNTESGSDIHSLRVRIFSKICAMLWDTEPLAQKAASSTLREMNGNGCLQDQYLESYAPKIRTAELLKVYSGIKLDSKVDRYKYHKVDLKLKLKRSRNYLSENESSKGKSYEVDLWDKTVWSTKNKLYNAWISTLTAHVISTFYDSSTLRKRLEASTQSLKLTKERNDYTAAREERLGMESQLREMSYKQGCFLASLHSVCILRPELAEAVLPLLLYDIVCHSEGSHNSIAKISGLLTKYLLSPNCMLPEATRLGCSILTFFLRQEITDFKQKSRSSILRENCNRDTRTPGKSSKTIASNQISSGINLFSYRLNVDLLYAAQAAVRCGCICTALIFTELSHEHSRTSAIRAKSTSQKKRSSELEGEIPKQSTSAIFSDHTSDETDDRHAEILDLLLCIFKGTHDPDALLGMLSKSNDLEVQALIYAHTGSWVEALSTYESLVQTERYHNSTRIREIGFTHMSGMKQTHDINHRISGFSSGLTSPRLGIASALKGLGSQHVLSAYAAACQNGTCLGPRGQGSGNVAEIIGLASEHRWRDFNMEVESNSRHYDGIQNQSDYSNLKLWSHEMHVPSAPIVSEEILKLSFPTKLPKMKSSVLERNQFRSDIMTSAEHFNCNIAAALHDMQKGFVGNASVCVDKGSDQLFPFILEARSQESAYTLMPSLIRAQQLFEVMEVSKIINHFSMSSNLLGSKTTVDALLSKWDERLSCGASVSSNETILSLRLSLLTKLLNQNIAEPGQVLHLMSQIESCIPGHAKDQNMSVCSTDTRGSAVIHALSPLAYRVKGMLNEFDEKKKYLPHGQYSSTQTVQIKQANLWRIELLMHESKLLWKRGLERVALSNLDEKVIEVLKTVVTQPSRGNVPMSANGESYEHASNLLSSALRQGGEWMSIKRAANGVDILNEYMQPAEMYAVGRREKIKAYHTLASFNDHLYQSALARVGSEEHKQLVRVLEAAKIESQECERLWRSMSKEEQARDKKTKRHIEGLRIEIRNDNLELETITENVSIHLVDALRNYGEILKLSENGDLDVVFRVISLWIKNSKHARVNEVIHNCVSHSSTYKFVPLTPQILSLLGSSELGFTNDVLDSSLSNSISSELSGKKIPQLDQKLDGPHANQKIVIKLVQRLCSEHPYHAIPQMFSLVNGDDITNPPLPGYTARGSQISSRYNIADQILSNLKQSESSISDEKSYLASKVIKSHEILLRSYISLANLNITKFVKEGRLNYLKFNEAQQRGKQFHKCLDSLKFKPAVLTISPSVQKNGSYEHDGVISIQSFLSEFSITDSGLSRPKIIQVRGSDGMLYKELVKGKDDMRQDAVMEQVFENVNITLKADSETQTRCLRIRTYTVVPLTPQSGVIQWVENARPFGDFLVHPERGAHARYYPNDITHKEARKMIEDQSNKSSSSREKALLEVYSRFHPAFRFFFIENFPDPAQWLSCRLAYTRSVAVNSMVGYILGIGDRHAQNVMVDQVTAEVVHIDFGIVFEQAKLLPTPETVPFRLTRDILDGMGITGVEGTFRKSCEEVLRVLRQNLPSLLTILEVVIRDPLYKWTLSPLEARKRQEKGEIGFHVEQRVGMPSQFGRLKESKLSRKDPTEDATLLGTGASSAGGGIQTSTPEPENLLNQQNQASRDAAERTLMRIRSKLQGYEDSAGESLSLDGHVELLITLARDPKNLAKLYVGWSPWL